MFYGTYKLMMDRFGYVPASKVATEGPAARAVSADDDVRADVRAVEPGSTETAAPQGRSESDADRHGDARAA